MPKSFLLLLLLSLIIQGSLASEQVVVYSERREQLIEPIFQRYTDETGVQVRYITDQAPVLVERLAAEGVRTQADLLMAVDAGSLWLAAERGVLREVDSELLQQRIPAHLRDPERRWFGLAVRARTLVYNTERVAAGELQGYADLADPRWRGRLCLRSARKVYNQSLVATLIAHLGSEATETLVRGWVANLAAPPMADDTLVLRAVAAGQCDVGLVNTYYFGRLLRDQPELPLRLHWAEQEGFGVHVNIAGAGITRHAPRPEAAQRLLEWLASEGAQADFAGINLEYPVNPAVAADPQVAAWGEFPADLINVSEAGRGQAAAVRLMDRAGWR